ncbi:TPA: hypothetical protein RJS82_003275 [Pseudomonas aeruginosa]|nr:hypothetical protein [Pseudomonas aeruginosa]HBO7374263.1 hypothetical protein [Pseudomonas aeruginosa]HDV6568173.1 hypothetical protein [Pseudomonas aeruginosa]HDV6574903.1 hypothetical protein [Pseudomonas aeruginosa]HEP9790575.1 hypothetical protein [Pseudomonas aeruginosa]
MAEELRKRALALYTPPFSYDSFGGYIWDAKQNMVADNHVDGDQVLRVRGWGRIVYMENPEELQDEFGAMLAEALTEYVERRNGSEEGHVVVPREVLERSIDRWSCCAMSQTPGAEEAWEELRALLSEQDKRNRQGTLDSCYSGGSNETETIA